MAAGDADNIDSTKPGGIKASCAVDARAGLVHRVLSCIAFIIMLIAVGDMRQVTDFSGTVSAWQLSRAAAARDFYQVWWPAKSMAFETSVDLYSPQLRKLMGHRAIARVQAANASSHERTVLKYISQHDPNFFATTFTPVMVSSYVLFAGDDYDAMRRVFALVSLCAFAGGLLLLCRLAGVGWASAFAIVAVVAWTCQPLRNDIIDGNVNRLQIGATGLYLWITLRRPHAIWQMVAGMLVGGLVLFKPNLALLPVFIAASLIASAPRTRWLQQGTGMAVAGLLGIILPAFIFDAPLMWLRWLQRMNQIYVTPYGVESDNIATARLILESTGLNLSLPLAIALSASGIFLCVWLARRGQGLTPQLALFACGSAAMVAMIAGQLAWPHYALLLLPLLLAGWSSGGQLFTPSHLMPRALIVACYVVIAERHLRQIFDLSNMTYGWMLALAMLIAAAVAAYGVANSKGPSKVDIATPVSA